MTDPWLELGPASYEIPGAPALTFMLVSQEIGGGNRVPGRERPYRRGEKLDFTGAQADTISLRAIFHNDLSEPGVGVGPQMWPDRLDEIERMFGTGETGTLHLPWRRNIRCKPMTWRRSATAETDRGGETLTVEFKQDNEDDVDVAALQTVSVRANVNRMVVEAIFDMEREGMWDGSFEDFTEFAADLEGVMNSPNEFLDDVSHKARRVERAAESIINSFTSRTDGRNQMTRPAGSRAEQRLRELIDMVASAAGEAEGSSPIIVTRVFPMDRDIYDIGAELGQSARELIAINPDLEDIGHIPAGTSVRVFAG